MSSQHKIIIDQIPIRRNYELSNILLTFKMRVAENFNNKVHRNEESVIEVGSTLCSINWAKVLMRQKRTNIQCLLLNE